MAPTLEVCGEGMAVFGDGGNHDGQEPGELFFGRRAWLIGFSKKLRMY